MDNRLTEQAVIGAILIDNESLHDIDLIPDDFFYVPYRHAFQAILDMGSGIDLLTLDAATKGHYTADLMECSQNCTAANIKHYAGIVKQTSQRRKILKLINTAIVDINDKEPSQLISDTVSGLTAIESARSGDYIKVRSAVSGVVEGMINRKIKDRGTTTHIRSLDHALGFLRNGDLIILAARPSMGKTALALSILTNIAINGDPVLLFSLEMGVDQIIERSLSGLAGVSMQDINCGINLEHNAGKIVKAAPKLHGLPILLNDTGGISYNQIERIIRRAHREEGVKIVFIDYLQLIGMTKSMGDNRNQQIGHVTRNLKALAKNLNIPIVLLSQLNRSLEQRTNKRPMLSDLRESGEIEQDADVVMFIYRDELYNEKSDHKGTAEIIIAKYRNGATGWLKLAFLSESMRFADLEEGVI